MQSIRATMPILPALALPIFVSTSPPANDRIAPPPSPPQLELAQPYTPGIEIGDYWVSEKLDGVRAYWNGRELVSRQGHIFQAPSWFTRGLPDVPLDGELWIGRGKFDRLSGIVRRKSPDDRQWRNIRYIVFDLPDHPGSFSERKRRLETLMAKLAQPHLRAIEQFRVRDHARLMAKLDAFIAAGAEGLMLHRAAAVHQGARTPELLKLKPHFDAEATVIAHLPGRGKYQGMLGALLVRDDEGREFGVGTGFSDAERRSPPAVGSRITFTYRGRTPRGLPRFASFLRVRLDEPD